MIKYFNRIIISISITIFVCTSMSAADYYSRASGIASGAIFNNTPGCSGGASSSFISASTNSMIICNGTNVTINAATSALNITIMAGGILTISTPVNVIVSGNFDNQAGAVGMALSNGTVTIGGTGGARFVNANGGAFSAFSYTASASAALTLQSALNASGNITLGCVNSSFSTGAGPYFNVVAGGTISIAGVSCTVNLNSSSLNITGDYIQSSASSNVNAGSASILVAGNWNQSAGTFNAGTSNVSLTSAVAGRNIVANSPFYNLTTTGTGSWLPTTPVTTNADLKVQNGLFNANNQTITVLNNVEISGGTLDLSANTVATPLQVGGSWTKTGGTFTSGAGSLVSFNSASAGKIITSGGSPFRHVEFNNATGGWAFADAFTANGNFTLSNGSLNPGTWLLSFGGNFLKTAGSFAQPVGATTRYIGNAASTINSSAQVLHNFQIGPTATGTLTLTSPLSISNSLELMAGTAGTLGTANYSLTVVGPPGANVIINAGTLDTSANSNLNPITINGSWTKNGGNFNSGSSSEFRFTATMAGKTIRSGGASFNNVLFDGVAGEWTMQDSFSIKGSGSLTLTNGTVNLSTFTHFIGDDALGPSALIFGGAGATLNGDSSTIQLNGNWSRPLGTFNAGSSTLLVRGTNNGTANTYGFNGGPTTFYNLTFNNQEVGVNLDTWNVGAASISISNQLSVTKGTFDIVSKNLLGGGNLTVNGGTLLASGGNHSVGNVTITSGAVTFSGIPVLSVQGSWSLTGGSFTAGSSTVQFTSPLAGQTVLSSSNTFYNCLFIGTGTYSLTDALKCDNDFRISAGVLNLSGFTMTASDLFKLQGGTLNAGNSVILAKKKVEIAGGVFNAGTSTLRLDGLLDQTWTISGLSLYNLEILNGGKQVTFDNSVSIEITNNFKALGSAPGTELTLNSGGTTQIKSLGTSLTALLSVANIDASPGNTQYCYNCNDSGGNTNWEFDSGLFSMATGDYGNATSWSYLPCSEGPAAQAGVPSASAPVSTDVVIICANNTITLSAMQEAKAVKVGPGQIGQPAILNLGANTLKVLPVLAGNKSVVVHEYAELKADAEITATSRLDVLGAGGLVEVKSGGTLGAGVSALSLTIRNGATWKDYGNAGGGQVTYIRGYDSSNVSLAIEAGAILNFTATTTIGSEASVIYLAHGMDNATTSTVNFSGTSAGNRLPHLALGSPSGGAASHTYNQVGDLWLSQLGTFMLNIDANTAGITYNTQNNNMRGFGLLYSPSTACTIYNTINFGSSALQGQIENSIATPNRINCANVTASGAGTWFLPNGGLSNNGLVVSAGSTLDLTGASTLVQVGHGLNLAVGTFTAGSSTMEMLGYPTAAANAYTFISGGNTFYKLKFNAENVGDIYDVTTNIVTASNQLEILGGQVSSSQNIGTTGSASVIIGDMTGPAAQLSFAGAQTLAVRGNLTISGDGSIVPGTWTALFNATALGNTVTTSGNIFYNVNFNGIGGGWVLQDNLTVQNQFYCQNGSVSTGADRAINVQGTGTLSSFELNGINCTVVANNSIITIGKGATRTLGTFSAGGSTMLLAGTNNAASDIYTLTGFSGTNKLNNLTIGNVEAGLNIDTYTLGSAIDVGGNFTLTKGALNTSGSNYPLAITGNYVQNGADSQIILNTSQVYIAGNLSYTAGTFNAMTSTMNLNRANTTQTIVGNIAFNNLILSGAASPRTIMFQQGSTTTVAGAFSANGTAGNLLTLDTDTGAGTFTIAGSGTKNASFVIVSRSVASGADLPVRPSGSTDGGTNTNWFSGNYFSTGSGDFSLGSTFGVGTSCGANSGPAKAPLTDDNITVCAGHTVRLNSATQSANNLEIETGGILDFAPYVSTNSLEIKGSANISGTWTLGDASHSLWQSLTVTPTGLLDNGTGGTMTFRGTPNNVSDTYAIDIQNPTQGFYNWVFDNQQGGAINLDSWSLASNLQVGQNITLAKGTVTANTFSLSIANNYSQTSADTIFNSGSAAHTLGGNLNIANGIFNAQTGTLNIAGSFTLGTGTLNAGTSTFNFLGSNNGTQNLFTITSPAGGSVFYALNIANTQGVPTPAIIDRWTMAGGPVTSSSLSIVNGELNTATFALTVNGALVLGNGADGAQTAVLAGNTSSVTVAGNWSRNPVDGFYSWTAGNAVYLTGTGNISGMDEGSVTSTPGTYNSFYDLHVAYGGQTTSLNATANTVVQNALYLHTGTLQTAPGFNLIIHNNANSVSGVNPVQYVGGGIFGGSGNIQFWFFKDASGQVRGATYGNLNVVVMPENATRTATLNGPLNTNGNLVIRAWTSGVGEFVTNNNSVSVANLLLDTATDTTWGRFTSGNSTVVVAGSVTVASSASGGSVLNMGTGSFSVQDNFSIVSPNGVLSAGTSTLTMKGSNNGTANAFTVQTNGNSLHHLIIDNAQTAPTSLNVDTWALQGNTGLTGNLSINNGGLDTSASNYSLSVASGSISLGEGSGGAGSAFLNGRSSTITLSGNWNRNTTDGWFTATNSAGVGPGVIITGTGSIGNMSGDCSTYDNNFWNLSLSSALQTSTVTGNVYVCNVTTLGAGSLNINAGSELRAYYSTFRSATVNILSVSSTTINGPGTLGVTIWNGGVTVPIPAMNLGTASLLVRANNGNTVLMNGNLTSTGNLTVQAGTVAETSTLDTSGVNYSLTFSNITLGSGTVGGRLFANSSNVTITNGLTIDLAGLSTVTTTGGTWSIAGNLVNSAPVAPTLTGSTFVLNGTVAQTIMGNTSFNNLTISSTVARAVRFNAGNTFTVTGQFSATGVSAASRLSINSTVATTPFNLNLTGTKGAIQYVDVSDSNASGSTVALPILAVVGPDNADSGGNTSWFPLSILYSRISGNFSDGNSWSGSPCGGGQPIAALIPNSGMSAVVCGTHNISVNANSAARSLTVETNGTLTGAGVFTLEVSENVLFQAGSISSPGSMTLRLAGTNNSTADTYTVTSNGITLPPILADNAEVGANKDTYTMADALISSGLTIMSGTFSTSNFTLTINGNMTQSGGTLMLQNSSVISGGTIAISAGTFNAGTSSIRLRGSMDATSQNQDINFGGNSVHNLYVDSNEGTVANQDVYRLASNITIGGTFAIEKGKFNTSNDGGATSYNMTVTGNITIGDGSGILSDSVLSANSSQITTNGNFTRMTAPVNDGNYNYATGNKVFMTGNGKIVDGMGGAVFGNNSFFDLNTAYAGSTITHNGASGIDLVIHNQLTLHGGTLNENGTVQLISGSGETAGKIILLHTASSVSAIPINFNGSGGGVTSSLTGSSMVFRCTVNCQIPGGTSVNYAQSFMGVDVRNTSTATLNGTMNTNASILLFSSDSSNGIFEMNGNNLSANAMRIGWDQAIQSTWDAVLQTTSAASLTLNGLFILENGSTLQGTDLTMNAGGNYTITGTFNPGNSTVNLNGTGAQTIAGNITFNNLNISSVAARTVTFTTGNTFTVSGQFSATGVSAVQRLSLKSNVALTAFVLNANGTKGTIQYVDVQDSNVSGSSVALPMLAAVGPDNANSGGNSGWFPITMLYSRLTGNWNTATTWSDSSCGGTAGTVVPSGTIDVEICLGHTVTFNSGDSNPRDLNVNGGNLDLVNGSPDIQRDFTLNAGIITQSGGVHWMGVLGNYTQTGGTAPGRVSLNAVAIKAISKTGGSAGDFDISGLYQASSSLSISNLYFTGAGNLNLNGNNLNTGLVTMYGGTSLLNVGTGNLATTGNISIGTGDSLTLTSGTISTSANVTIDAGGTLNLGSGNVSMTGGGTSFTANGTFNAGTSLVTMNHGVGIVTMTGSPSFYNLTVNNDTNFTGVGTLQALGTFTHTAGNVNIADGATLISESFNKTGGVFTLGPTGVSTLEVNTSFTHSGGTLVTTAGDIIRGTAVRATGGFYTTGGYATLIADNALADGYLIDTPVYVQVRNLNANKNAGLAETINVTITSSAGESENLVLNETGLGTGIFNASVPTTSIFALPTALNAIYELKKPDVINLSYSDADDVALPDQLTRSTRFTDSLTPDPTANANLKSDSGKLADNYIDFRKKTKTMIGFNLTKEGNISVHIFDSHGRRIKTVLSQSYPAGSNFYTWDVRSDNLRSGLYYMHIESSVWSKPEILKFIVVR